MSGVLFYHSLPCYLDPESGTEPGTWPTASHPSHPPVPAPQPSTCQALELYICIIVSSLSMVLRISTQISHVCSFAHGAIFSAPSAESPVVTCPIIPWF